MPEELRDKELRDRPLNVYPIENDPVVKVVVSGLPPAFFPDNTALVPAPRSVV
jgi:hypothetical protein